MPTAPRVVQRTRTPAIPTISNITSRDLESSLCRDSFFDFFLRFWPCASVEKLVANWHIEYLCHELQIVAERVFKRQPKEYDLVINICPGSTKSIITSILFPAWCWCREPSFRVINACYASDLSLFLANQCRRILTHEKYYTLFPYVKLVSEGLALMQTDQNGQRIAAGVGGRIMGMHAHISIVDDPINPRDALTDAGLLEANTWYDQTLPSRMVSKALTPIITVMQRLHQNDPTAHILEKALAGGTPVRHICIPADLGEYGEHVRPRSLRKKYVDNLFDPVRLPRHVLQATKLDMGEYGYAGQYGQYPVPAGASMFNVDSLIMETELPTHFNRIVRYWDKAGTGSDRAAWTVGGQMLLDRRGEFWIIDIVRGQWEAAKREAQIQTTAKIDTVRCKIGIEQEPGSGGKDSAKATVKGLAGHRVFVDRPTGDKIVRADPFATQVNAGHVHCLQRPWTKALLDEMRFFPKSRWKDQVDALSGAFGMLTKRIKVGGLW